VTFTVLLLSGLAYASPLRVAIVTFTEARPSWRGGVLADELADRLAVAGKWGEWSVAGRDHVREAEAASGAGGGSDDSAKLVAIGRRLHADLIVGGKLDGSTARAVVVQPASGAVDEMSADASRPDRAAAELATALLRKRNVTVAPLAKKAIESTPGQDKAYDAYGEGRALLQQKNLDGAIAKLSAAIALDPSLARAQAQLAHAYTEKKEDKPAAEAAKLALDRDAGSREVRFEAARVDDFADRVDAAVERYHAVLEIAPHDAAAHANLGRLLFFKRHDAVAGAKEMEAALDCEPGWELARFNVGLARLSLGRVDDALAAFEKLHEDKPENPVYAVRAAMAYRLAERPASAEKLMRQALAQSAKNVEVRAELAADLAALGRFDEAVKLLDDPDAPKDVRLAIARARVLFVKGDTAQAIAFLDGKRADLAAARQRDRRDALVMLGVARLAGNDAAGALKELKVVVDEDPRDGEAQYDLGLAALGTGDKALAADALKQACALNPSSAAPALALGQLELDRDAAGAAKVYRAPLDAGATDARLRVGLGLALWRSGQLEPAIEELRKAADAHPRADVEAEARYDLGEALLAAGKRADAKQAMARYLELEKRPHQERRLDRARLLVR